MKEDIKAEMVRLAELCVKMEGLCLVLAEREDEVARRLLDSCHVEFDELYTSLCAEVEPDVTTESAAEQSPAPDMQAAEAAVVAEFIDNVLVDDNEAEHDASPVELSPEPDVVEEAPVQQTEPEAEVEPEAEAESEAKVEPEAEPEHPVTILAGSEEYEAYKATASEAEPVEPEVAVDTEAVAEAEVKEEAKPEMRVDEMLSRREARELRKAFTLNDKFRFRRELFNNDNDLFRDTLERIEQMSSNEEAVAYMTDVLGWNLEEEAPADFAATVANHFAGL